jgi:NADH-quinone oxidoreductase subunit B
MLLDAIVKLHDKIQNMKLGANREAEVEELEQARLRRLPLTQGTGGQLGIGGGQPQPGEHS